MDIPCTWTRPLHSDKTLALRQDPCTQTRPLHSDKTLALRQDPCTQTRPLHSDKTLALRQDPCTQTMTSLNICTWLSIVNSTFASIHHHLLLSDHLLPSNCFCLSWPFHIFGSVPQDQPSHMFIMGLAWPSGSYH